jgi:hypothetical protein
MRAEEGEFCNALLVRSIAIDRTHDFDRMVDKIRIAIRCAPLDKIGHRSGVEYRKFYVGFDVEPEDECEAADALVTLLKNIREANRE